MDEYTQSIDLKFISNIDDIQQQLSDLKTNLKANFTVSGQSNVESNNINDESTLQFAEAINEFVRGNDFLNEMVSVQLPTTWGSMVAKITKGLLSMFQKAWDELDEMFSYNYLSNSSVRDLRLTWGLDAGEAYAYSTAADMMGISSLEDFSFMNEAELATFEKASNRLYEVWSEYGNDTELSDALMDFKVEMQVLKVELLQPFLEVLTAPETKEVIKEFIDYLPDFISALIDISKGLTEWLTEKGLIARRTKTNNYHELYEEEMTKSSEERDYQALAEAYNEISNRPYGEMSVEQYKKMFERDETLRNISTSVANNIQIFVDGVKQKFTEKSETNKNVYSAQTNQYYSG